MAVRILPLGAAILLLACGRSSAPSETTVSGAAASAVTAAQDNPAYPWGHVKAWTGTVTVEATEASTEGGRTRKASYTATGNITIADDAMPDGAHGQWPNPDPAIGALEPLKYMEGFKRWSAHAVYSSEVKGVGESGEPINYKCSGEGTSTEKVQLVVNGLASQYQIVVAPPEVKKVQCAGPTISPETIQPESRYAVPQPQITLLGRSGPPAPFNGTDTQTFGSTTVKVTYKFEPAK